MTLPDPIVVVARLSHVFETLGIPSIVGGSLASSVFGIPRSTNDVDIIAPISLPDVEPVANALAGDFYVDAGMIREAVQRSATFNVIHLATMFKADVFILGRDDWSRGEMSRAREHRFDDPEGAVTLRFASPEDTVLHKLVWYRLGKEISDRQWSDILGVLRIQGNRLDDAYVERWAAYLGVTDLLIRARNEA